MNETSQPLSPEQVRSVSDRLRAHAEHFVQKDWDYSRLHDIRHIRHEGDYAGFDHPARRLARAARAFTPRRKRAVWERALLGPDSESTSLARFRSKVLWMRAEVMTALRTDRNLPDGVLDGGGIITHWEETGEYLQYVQPSVASRIANFLDAEPDHPHAVEIAAEMSRIEERYSQRVSAGLVDGGQHENENDEDDSAGSFPTA